MGRWSNLEGGTESGWLGKVGLRLNARELERVNIQDENQDCSLSFTACDYL